ncbi:NDR1/HIN1-like protein 13 [Salvia miltiorrhiza]|uniref:NDR1/HIN1-like protein 13 n=1 Tax=Salvia miltiorrhiza TaxID=226208 RepID=UPI0025AB88EA|nr:NDR1/HIN1-like protein 13 [Salvia miltiorrhiza]
MEERLPPSNDANTNADTDANINTDAPPKLPLPLPPGRAAHETYVVQIPRDNVCRVPPPDHARIVEEHTRKAAVKMSQPRRRRFRCSLALPIFLIVIVATIAILTARATIFRPIKPAFAVTRIRGDNLVAPPSQKSNSTRRGPEFRVGIRADNRNPWMSVNYCGGGAATLDFKDKRIGQGKVPATISENEEGNANFAVVLAGKGVAALPKDVKEKLTGEEVKLMELSMDLTVEMRSYLRNEQLKLQIFCDFKVRNSLAKNAKIILQNCATPL